MKVFEVSFHYLTVVLSPLRELKTQLILPVMKSRLEIFGPDEVALQGAYKKSLWRLLIIGRLILGV